MKPSLHNFSAWQRHFLDTRRRTLARPMLDTAAYLLHYLPDRPALHQLALEHLLDRFDAGRADLGFGTPEAETYAPSHDCRASPDIPSVKQFTFPNRDPGVQVVWQAPQGVVLDIHRDPRLSRLRPEILGTLGVQSKLAHRLEGGGQVFGLVCVDQVGERRNWSTEEVAYLHTFSHEVLGPLLLAGLQLSPPAAPLFSETERRLLELLELGMTAKEIGAQLGKSPNTVENQLSALRRRTGARNRVELLKVWEAARSAAP